MKKADLVIVGAGIVGLAHAWAAARRGLSVIVLERSPRSEGASIRNFGMIWPVGQSEERRETALLGRARWIEAAQKAGFWLRECGSLHMAHSEDEWAVLEEFAARNNHVHLLNRDAVLDRAPGANHTNLQGALWSDAELAVDPREAVRKLAEWLAAEHGVEIFFNTAAGRIEPGSVTAADGRRFAAERILACPGYAAPELFPRLFQQAKVRLSKLQMMRTGPQPKDFRLGPHLAGGLTLRHYESFRVCPSLPALERRVAEQTPELNRYGIHVMAAQNALGEVILGDSHVYDDEITPFNSVEIDRLILRELHRIIRLPNWSIETRWFGVYAKPACGYLRQEVAPNVHAVLGIGGTGMTLSFGYAEEFFAN